MFEVGVAMFLKEGKCCWCRDYHLVYIRSLVRVCGLVRVRSLVRVCDGYLQLWGSGLVLALNREDL